MEATVKASIAGRKHALQAGIENSSPSELTKDVKMALKMDFPVFAPALLIKADKKNSMKITGGEDRTAFSYLLGNEHHSYLRLSTGSVIAALID
jgi:hypothetical protein